MASGEYDFIIVGGGTAGLVLANRLTEDPSQSVLVLEAGSDHSESPRVKAPAFYQTLLATDLDWGFRTEPQERLNGRKINLNQGKVLGGSSVISACLFAPPTKAIIDTWAALGNDGWDWDTLKSYYAKVYTPPVVPKSSEKKLALDGWAAKSDDTARGPVKVSFPGDHTHPIREAWVQAFKDRGYFMRNNPWVSGEAVGAFSVLATIDPTTGERNHAAKTYYSPVKERGNLHTLTNTVVDKIMFGDGDLSNTAVGVRYHSQAGMKTVSARKEVIIAAGALQSPKLLELSGIGDPDLLKRHGIEVVKDLVGVGENLQDHLACDLGFEAADGVDTLDAIERREPDALKQAMQDFTNHTGPLISSGMKTFAYMPAIEHVAGHGWDVLRKLLDQNRPPKAPRPDPTQARATAFHEVAEKALFDPNQPSAAYLTTIGQYPGDADPATRRRPPALPGKYITLAAVHSGPLSRGSVHIRSASGFEAPAIDPRYFTHPVDVEVYTQHMLYLQGLAGSRPLGALFRQPLRAYNAAPPLANFYAAVRYIQSRAVSMWHPAGTCAMLPEDRAGVVDSRLRVYGVRGLRVVDASVVPLLPPGNLQSTVYALAERAADIIKEDYGLVTAS
ncbi:putative GMC oxidoreductase [Biscogniauxia mediterranea]|nr:putative GMC oxidoreductase [Biscogniauxia mediterranea]